MYFSLLDPAASLHVAAVDCTAEGNFVNDFIEIFVTFAGFVIQKKQMIN